MRSEAFISFSSEFSLLVNVSEQFATSTNLDTIRLAASGIFIQAVSKFEVYFEDCINEYCRTKLTQLSDRHIASAFSYYFKKSIFEQYTLLRDERLFINCLEKEITSNKEWLNIKTITSLDSTKLIGRKDYPKPEHILLAFYKIGKDENAPTILSRGLNDSFKSSLNRILELRNTIAHDGIPQEWRPSEIKNILSPLSTIAANIDYHLFG